jgi:hypothetical protein
MQLVITEKQLKMLSSQFTEAHEVKEQDDPAAAAPDTGTSSDGEKKTGATKWESGVTRGPGNQIGVTKWSDTVGSSLKRGKANPLSEQAKPPKNISLSGLFPIEQPRASSDYFADVDRMNKQKLKMAMLPVTKYIYKTEDNKNFFINMAAGNIPGALLDLREFLFDPWAIGAEITLSIIFSETIVVPVAFTVLNAIVLLNDLYLFEYQGQEDEASLVRVIEDLFVFATMGVIRIGRQGVKVWMKNPQNLRKLVALRGQLKGLIDKAVKLVGSVKLPSAITQFINKQIGKLNNLFKILDDLLNSAPKPVAKVSKAILAGLVGVVGVEALNKLLGLSPGSKETETNPEKVFQGFQLTKQKKDYLVQKQEDIANYRKSGDWDSVAKEIAQINANSLPCLLNYYKQGEFKVQLTSNKGNIYIIKGRQYYQTRFAILDVKTDQEFSC